jgi:sugar phosphate isomerase/epimerase
MERFYGDHFKQIFDFANFVQCGQEVFVAFEILKPYIAYIHIKDASMDTHQVVPAGMGDGHLAEILGQLKAENYDGFYSMEPHLAEFAGLRSLEREGEKSILGDKLTDGELGFVTAYQAFLKIIER